ncbi:MAG: phage portal protein [Chloroflexi bacterium]|nr:phage portal protein [Chloroflexota bacterium]
MFNWLGNLFSARQKRLRKQAPHIEAVATHNRYQLGPPIDLNSGRVYEQSPWVYIAINRIAEAAALVPLRVFRLEGEKRIGIANHPLEQLLGNPNPLTSGFELLEQTIGSLELQGNAYWYLAGDASGVPQEIWVLRPDRVTIVPDATRVVAGYLYEVDGQYIPLDAIEVAHFRRWHPNNDFYGLSPISAARCAILSDRHMADWNRNTFGQDKGVPAGIVNIKDFVSDADFERVKREWRQHYGGTARKTAFLRGGDIEWQNIGLSHTDLDFLQGRKAQRDEILNIFGIPVGLISENATEANAKVAERQFIERALWPKLVRLAQKISAELLPFYGGNLIAEFDDIRPTDTEARLAEIRTAYPLLSVNELRERYFQLPPVAWGDVAVGSPHPPAPSPKMREGEHEAAKSVLDELAQWERFALNRLDREERGRPFEVSALPDELAFEVSAGLMFAGDREAVKSVFAGARAGMGSTPL